MLIGKEARRPNREKIRNIKEALGTALSLPEETAVSTSIHAKIISLCLLNIEAKLRNNQT